MMRAGVTMALMLAYGAARADGLADLKSALAKATGSTPLKVQIDTRTWRKQGEGKDADEETSQASLALEESARGLSVTHSRQTMARIEAEMSAKAKNPNSKTPTLSALADVDMRDMLAMTSPANALTRRIERDAFKGERAETYQGKPARVLTFEAPISSLSDRERKYAKKFLSVLEVWIGADGMPLASRARTTISGRAFVVVSFEASDQEDKVFSAVGDHLLVTRKESHNNSAGAGEKEERKVVTTLQVQSAT
ncbi:MAG: hypothetical protein V4484_13880 [Pseudomonadota bacterium]